MAGITRLVVGHDASYPFTQIDPDAEKTYRTGYYLDAVENGEPPGVWTGHGVDAVGFHRGDVIRREPFEKLYGDFTDPVTGEQLGRAPQKFSRTPDVIYALLLKTHPEATPGERRQMRLRAEKEARHPVHYWDATFSPSKSITMAWMIARGAAAEARAGGEDAEAAEWDELARRVWSGVWKGNLAMLDRYQASAGVTRAGHHGGKRGMSGREAGQWVDARKWVIGSFRQHTSRDGDPQLHVHNLILHVVRREDDQHWRRMDGEALARFRREANAAGVAVMEDDLSTSAGARWVARRDGHGLELAGVPQALMDKFSSRRDSVTAYQMMLAEQYRAEHGRDPDARTLERMRQQANFATRKGKEGMLDLPASIADWAGEIREAGFGTCRQVGQEMVAGWERAREAEQAEAGVRADVVASLARTITAELERSRGGGARHNKARRDGAGRSGAERSGAGQAREAEARSIERFASFVTRGGTVTGTWDAALLLGAWSKQQHADAEQERVIRRETALADARLQQREAEARKLDIAAVSAQAAAADGRATAGMAGILPRGPVPRLAMTAEQEYLVMAEAVTAMQESRSSWRVADLKGYVQEKLPAGAACGPDLVDKLACRIMTGQGGPYVALLSAPEWPRVPDGLRRQIDASSVFRPPGAELYATQDQISLEERLMSDAQAPAAPHLDPGRVAALLGAEPEVLREQLRSGGGRGADGTAGAGAAAARMTGSGLRLDQAASVEHLLCSPRRVEVLTGPAGSGKTRTATEMARIWHQAGPGPVVALTTSSNARNVIRREAADGGITIQAYNTAEWLGHTRTGREVGHPVTVQEGSLLILDEASMMSLADMAAILRRAARHSCKVIVTGDHQQLQAIEGGGGMAMMARQMGYAKLGEAQRFTELWEREASLRVRAGDVTVLADYAQHGRLAGGTEEEMMEAAARGWLADYLDGNDPILMCATEERAADLSRRIRDDLVRWGIVDGDGPSVELRGDTRASCGDLMMARRNDVNAAAQEVAGQLTNRDVLRLDDPDPDGTGRHALVSRQESGAPGGGTLWSAPFLVSRRYLASEAHLAYATTCHAGQGQTRGIGHAVFTGHEDLQAFYPSMTRGAVANYGYFFTTDPAEADPQAGTRPAPELARQRMLDTERLGLQPGGPDSAGTEASETTAAGVAARIMERDGQQLSATETRAAEYADADRLDLLYSQWEHITAEAAHAGIGQVLDQVLTPDQASEVRADPRNGTLIRALREASAAGLDPAETLDRAAGWGPLDTAQSLAKTIAWRVRHYTERAAVAAVQRDWSEKVPSFCDEDMSRYARELAEAMDQRTRRLGEHAASTAPLWARQGLGPVPADPVARLEWEHRAGLVAAYREMWGYAHPADPVGPRPGSQAPEARAMWQAAVAALTRRDGIDMSALTDGQLHARRAAWEREVGWAPPCPAADLEAARGAERSARVRASRAGMEARTAPTPELRVRHQRLHAAEQRNEDRLRERGDRLAAICGAYAEWEAFTEATRRHALAADAELRRRHPELARNLEPLSGSPREHLAPEPGTGPAQEPEPCPETSEPLTLAEWWERFDAAADAAERSLDRERRAALAAGLPWPPPPGGRQVWIQPTLDGAQHLTSTASQQAAEPDPTAPAGPVAGQLDLEDWARESEAEARIAEQEKAAAATLEKIAEQMSLTAEPAADPDAEPEPAWEQARREREAVWQQPRPHIGQLTPGTSPSPAEEASTRFGRAAARREPDRPRYQQPQPRGPEPRM